MSFVVLFNWWRLMILSRMALRFLLVFVIFLGMLIYLLVPVKSQQQPRTDLKTLFEISSSM